MICDSVEISIPFQSTIRLVKLWGEDYYEITITEADCGKKLQEWMRAHGGWSWSGVWYLNRRYYLGIST